MIQFIFTGRVTNINNLEKIEKALIAGFLAAVAFSLTSTIVDPDFWWHMASGRWIMEHSSIIQTDPFGYVSFPDDDEVRKQFIFRQYWLSQVLMHLVYRAFDFTGLIILRAIVLGAMFAALYSLMRLYNAGRAVAAFFVTLAAAAIVRELGYSGIRPQMFSSLGAIGVLWMLERYRAARLEGRRIKWPLIALPAVMLLWANMHGGYILGVLIIVIHTAVEAIRRKADKELLMVTGGAVLITILNPNGWQAVPLMLLTVTNPDNAAYMQSVVESQSILDHLQSSRGFYRLIAMMPMFSLLSAFVIVLLPVSLLTSAARKSCIIVLTLISLAMGLMAIRYLFFAILMAALVSSIGAQYITGLIGAKFRFTRYASPVVIAALLGLVAYHAEARSVLFNGKPPYSQKCAGAANFMKQTGLSGRLLNDYSDGGFLLWALYPQAQVFIDGRGLSFTAFMMARDIEFNPMAKAIGIYGKKDPIYRIASDRFGADIAVIHGADPETGHLVPLAFVLIRDPDWALVFADQGSMVFVRRSRERADFIAKYQQPKKLGYENMLALLNMASGNAHFAYSPEPNYVRAVALNGLGRNFEARQYIDRYMQAKPNDNKGADMRYWIYKDTTPPWTTEGPMFIYQ